MIRMELGPVFFFAGLPIGLWLGWLISVGGALATIVSIGLLAAVVGFVARTLYVVRSSRDRAFKARILTPEKDGAVTESPYALTPYIKEKAEREGWGILDLGEYLASLNFEGPSSKADAIAKLLAKMNVPDLVLVPTAWLLPKRLKQESFLENIQPQSLLSFSTILTNSLLVSLLEARAYIHKIAGTKRKIHKASIIAGHSLPNGIDLTTVDKRVENEKLPKCLVKQYETDSPEVVSFTEIPDESGTRIVETATEKPLKEVDPHSLPGLYFGYGDLKPLLEDVEAEKQKMWAMIFNRLANNYRLMWNDHHRCQMGRCDKILSRSSSSASPLSSSASSSASSSVATDSDDSDGGMEGDLFCSDGGVASVPLDRCSLCPSGHEHCGLSAARLESERGDSRVAKVGEPFRVCIGDSGDIYRADDLFRLLHERGHKISGKIVSFAAKFGVGVCVGEEEDDAGGRGGGPASDGSGGWRRWVPDRLRGAWPLAHRRRKRQRQRRVDRFKHVPVCGFHRVGIEDELGGNVCLPIPHVSLFFYVSGPDFNFTLEWYEAIEGLTGYIPFQTVVHPWNEGRVVREINYPEVLEWVQGAAICSTVFNIYGDERELWAGGYGISGVCSDAVALVERAIAGETNLYPLVALGSVRLDMMEKLLTIARDIEMEVALKQVKKERGERRQRNGSGGGGNGSASGSDDEQSRTLEHTQKHPHKRQHKQQQKHQQKHQHKPQQQYEPQSAMCASPLSPSCPEWSALRGSFSSFLTDGDVKLAAALAAAAGELPNDTIVDPNRLGDLVRRIENSLPYEEGEETFQSTVHARRAVRAALRRWQEAQQTKELICAGC